MHQRTVIRDLAVSMLTDSTLAEGRVYPSRVKPFSARRLPAIGVYFNGGPADHMNRSPRQYVRNEDLVVEIVAAELADSKVDALLDAIGEQVEAIFLVDETLGGTVWDCELTESDLRPTSTGDRVFGSARLIFRVKFVNELPEGDLDDFLIAASEWDLGPDPDGVIDAEDTINLQE